MSLNSLINNIKVTSVLHDDNKTYGKQFLLDEREDTCWNSDSGLLQSIFVSFLKTVNLEAIQIMFQGGFVGIECDILLLGNDQNEGETIHTIYPEDINDLQTFKLPKSIEILTTQKLQLQFKQSSDFYGRVTVYIVNFEGTIHE